MKVQSQPQPAVAQSQNTTATASAKPAAADANLTSGKITDRLRDGFEQGSIKKPIIDCFPPFPPVQKDTMSLKDHLTAGNLSETLSNPLDKPLLDSGKKDQHLTRDENGVMRGPDGQPLAKVELKDGNTAYVDPNTNQYYLTDEPELGGFFGNRGVNALGPLPLPKDAQFSNSFFSDSDVRSIERDARGGGLHWPPLNPLPMPHPIPFDPPWGGPIKRIDPGILLDAAAGKTNGIE